MVYRRGPSWSRYFSYRTTSQKQSSSRFQPCTWQVRVLIPQGEASPVLVWKWMLQKTQVMMCGSGHAMTRLTKVPELFIDGNSLVPEEAVNDLGVHLDKRMTFTAHVCNMVRQLSGVLCYISRTRHSLTQHATRLLVNSVVLSKLSYWSAMWGGICKTDVIKLHRVVNFDARVIFNTTATPTPRCQPTAARPIMAEKGHTITCKPDSRLYICVYRDCVP